MRRMATIGMAVVLLACTAASADQLAKGDKELNFTFSYSDTSVDGGGDAKSADLSGSFGYLLTNHHEVGGILEYSKLDVDGVGDTDSTGLGVFYDYNFAMGENMNPYVGVHYLTVGGDAGDVLDNTYGARAGIKLYPWANGGFNFGIEFDKSTGADDFPDADTTSVFGGILVKFP